jgi:GTP-binding protein HflX
VRDISHPNTESHSEDVFDILQRIGLESKIPILEVWNKIDLLPENQRLQQSNITLSNRNIYPICASSGVGLENLKTGMLDIILANSNADVRTVSVRDGKKRAWLYRYGLVESETLIDEDYKMVLRWTEKQRSQFDLL